MSEGLISPAGVRLIRGATWSDRTSLSGLRCLGLNVLANRQGCIKDAAASIARALPKPERAAALPLIEAWLFDLARGS